MIRAWNSFPHIYKNSPEKVGHQITWLWLQLCSSEKLILMREYSRRHSHHICNPLGGVCPHQAGWSRLVLYTKGTDKSWLTKCRIPWCCCFSLFIKNLLCHSSASNSGSSVGLRLAASVLIEECSQRVIWEDRGRDSSPSPTSTQCTHAHKHAQTHTNPAF